MSRTSRPKKNRVRFPRLLVRLGLLLALLGLAPHVSLGDDRDLVRARSADPYVFILFDVSGSMNWGSPNDVFAPADGDDPNSKFFQAKSALFRVLTDPDLANVRWGFATYNQDSLRLFRKHWLYKPDGVVVPSWVTSGTLAYPRSVDLKYFGDRCMDDDDTGGTCDLDADDTLGSCGSPRDINTLEGAGELLTYPVTGDAGNVTTSEWVLKGNRHFLLTWQKTAGTLGVDPSITVKVTFQEYKTDCSATTGSASSATMNFVRAYTKYTQGGVDKPLSGSSDFIDWEIDANDDANGNPNGFWDPDDTNAAGGTCNGWEPNDTSTGTDDDAGVLIKYKTKDDPLNRHATAFDRGDVVPLDWKDTTVWSGQPAPFNLSNKDLILKKLAPNYDPTNSSIIPDFRVAHYFQDHPDTLSATASAGRLALLPAYTETPPLVPNGSTPIGNSMNNFMSWFDTWKPVASPAATGDPDFGCRTVSLIILTDGDETCYDDSISSNSADRDNNPETGDTDTDGDNNPCSIAKKLAQTNRNIKVYVVGYGVPTASANFLNCIAKNGCTGTTNQCNRNSSDPLIKPLPDGPGPILPGDEDELVDALKKVFEFIKAGSRSFASAAVPSVQANTQDKVVLSNFTPVSDSPIWPGHLDAYVKPVPFKDVTITLPDGTSEMRKIPDRSILCTSSLKVGCRTWDAADELKAQGPTAAQLTANNYNSGNGTSQRRIYYSQATTAGTGVPRARLLFEPPVSGDLNGWSDLLSTTSSSGAGLGICASGDLVCAANTTMRNNGTAVVKYVDGIKTYKDPSNPAASIDFLLGDVFHADPLVTGEPENFRYFSSDLYKSSGCGYRCYFEKQQNRRKVLLIGSDDGALHAFDAGTAFVDSTDGNKVKVSNGTGRELFAYIPRPVLPKLKAAKDDAAIKVSNHTFKVDGTPVVDDVFIDPSSTVTGGKEWRTVVIGGLREGGRGYYALDITQPDIVPANRVPQTQSGTYVPACSFDADGGPDCGQVPYPAVLWEFTDTCALNLPCDNDTSGPGLGQPDLGDTWSVPNIGRIRVCNGAICDPSRTPNNLVDRFVAIFGGGLDATLTGKSGNWLYMVDVETGKVLYKRLLAGSAASEPAAVDTDLDGYLDTIYIGTINGFLYKVDLQVPPLLVTVAGAVQIDTNAWKPFQIFDTEGRPIYYPPAVIYVASQGRYALSFGTGDRQDLWRTTGTSILSGRFFTILDSGLTSTTAGLPFKAASYKSLTATVGPTAGADYLKTPDPGKKPGWYLDLDAGERIITKSFALAGVTIFSSFQPRTDPTSAASTCGSTGISRIFVVNTVNANAFAPDGKRFRVVQDFVTSPYTELGQTKNVHGGSADPESLTTAQRDYMNGVMRELQKLFPKNCRFANYTINLKAVRSDTGIEFIAPVPVCIVEKNWKEF